MNIFKKFQQIFSHVTTTTPYAFTLGEQEICVLSEPITPSGGSRLIVHAGQTATLIKDVPPFDMGIIYTTGEYTLKEHDVTFLGKHAKVRLLILKIAPPTTLDWSVSITLKDSQHALPLKGHYTLAIDNPKQLLHSFVQNNIAPTTDNIKQWIELILKEIIQSQSISSEDINQYHQRFEQFLTDAANPILFERGLILRTVHLKSSSTHEENNQQNTQISQVTPDKKTPSPNVAPSPLTPPIDQAPKIYYRVDKGQQIGPLSMIEVQQLINEGQLKRHDLLWKKGSGSWQRAEQFKTFNWHQISQ